MLKLQKELAHVCSEYVNNLGCVIMEGELFQEQTLLRHRPYDSSQLTNKQTKV
jgi:hypothetical protein